VFETFTDRARRVLVLAQQEAGDLGHSFIGTEHILLGLIVEEKGIAAKALAQCGVELEDARREVQEIIGPQSAPAEPGSPPFTPRAKKVLELSLRESLQLGHNHIGTEHILLGVIREGEGVACQVLAALGADAGEVRRAVIGLLGSPAREQHDPSAQGTWVATASGRRASRRVACSFCGRQPPESGRMVSANRVFICERCIEFWSKELRADRPPTEPPSVHLYNPEEDQP
jgi:ATP-dependent Clp protease ATP-binding subunit ClpC